MGKHVTHSHCRVLHDVNTMTVEELEEEYSIEVDSDTGEVWDSFEGKTFPDVHHWAEFINLREREDAEMETGLIKTSRQRISDDY